MSMNDHNTKRDKSVKRPRAIGFVRRVLPPTPEKDGYGFIASNVFGLTNIDGRKEVDYYFKSLPSHRRDGFLSFEWRV